LVGVAEPVGDLADCQRRSSQILDREVFSHTVENALKSRARILQSSSECAGRHRKVFGNLIEAKGQIGRLQKPSADPLLQIVAFFDREKFFLTSHQPGSTAKEKRKYGIYALDAWGNRALLYEDPEISCFEPMPLRPRAVPTTVVPTTLVQETSGGKQDEMGTLFVQDVYEGMTGIERGRVKYLRVMGVLPWPWGENGIFHLGVSVHRKKVYGVAKVHEDGSARFQVPAGENFFVQALDENYMQLQHMSTFINVKPGENRSCVGCHEHRRKAPDLARARPLALDVPAQTLAPQPGDKGPRMVHYPVDVQPMLEKHCIKCHSGENGQRPARPGR
jgi:hypothetical protein